MARLQNHSSTKYLIVFFVHCYLAARFLGVQNDKLDIVSASVNPIKGNLSERLAWFLSCNNWFCSDRVVWIFGWDINSWASLYVTAGYLFVQHGIGQLIQKIVLVWVWRDFVHKFFTITCARCGLEFWYKSHFLFIGSCQIVWLLSCKVVICNSS